MKHIKKSVYLFVGVLLFVGCAQEIPVPFLVPSGFETDLQATGEVIQGRESIVQVLRKTTENQAFVVKQIREDQPLRLLVEAWIAHRALALQIPVVQTWLIPKTLSMPGKTYSDQLGSLQIKAPGEDLAHLKSYIRIQQKKAFQGEVNEKTKVYYEKRLKTAGLTKRVIGWMSLHPDLAKIVALDTFMNNTDRVRENIFYDRKKNRYVAIDHASALEDAHLAEHALRQLKRLRAQKARFSRKEIAGLKIYLDTLKQLQAQETAQKAAKTLSGYAEFLQISNSEKLQSYKQMIQKQNRAIVPLIAFLESFLYGQ